MKLLQVITCSFAILLVALLANGCVGALYIVWWGAIGTTIRGVLLVAMAAAGLAVMLGAFVWVLFFYRRPVYETHGQALLRILLKLALPTAFCPVCLPIFLLPVDWPLPRGWVSLAAVLASGGSVTLHRSGILSICSTYKKFHHV